MPMDKEKKEDFFQRLENSIYEAVKGRTRELAEGALQGVIDNMRKELEGSLDAIALRVLATYDIERNGDRVIISVQKKDLSE